MRVILKPISDEEYISFINELYENSRDGSRQVRFTVQLPEDPSVNPLELNSKLSKVQSLKDRLVVIMNRGLVNKSYWDATVSRVQGLLETEIASQLISNPDVKAAKNSDARNSMAEIYAKQKLHPILFVKYSSFDDGFSALTTKQAEANAFYNEVKNIYSNLDDKSMALAVQLKTIILNARLNGLVTLEGEDEVAR